MTPEDELLKAEICNLYTTLTNQAQTPFSLQNHYESVWIQSFSSLVQKAQEIAETKWPYYSKEMVALYTTEISLYKIDYEQICLKILNYYNPEKVLINKKTQKPYKISFWDYFISVLWKEVCRNATKMKIEKANNNRLSKVPDHKQRKINKLLQALKIYNNKNPQNKLHIYDKEAESYLIGLKIFDEEETKTLIKINNVSLNMMNVISENRKDDISSLDKELSKDQIHNNPGPDYLSAQATVTTIFKIINKGFLTKMNIKKQNEEAQKEKIDFMKQILTLHYLNKLTELFYDLTPEEIVLLMSDKDFFSKEIAIKFLKKQQDLLELIKTNKCTGNQIKQYQKITKPTMESVALNLGKPKNYGIKRITNFKQFCKSQKAFLLDDNYDNDEFSMEPIFQIITE
ncbi:MAG: hypothetical protein MJ188_00960 [Treponema sp.]|nr:hypothetical protein [Treponema sp.]